jgi:hypothetical protein
VHARRRTITFAALVTVIVLGGYFAYTAVVDDSSPASRYVDATEQIEDRARNVVQMGSDLRLLGLVYVFRDQVNGEIQQIDGARTTIEHTAARLEPKLRGVADQTIATVDDLQNALARYRDAIFLIRLGDVAPAEAAINDTLGRLDAQIAQWHELGGD